MTEIKWKNTIQIDIDEKLSVSLSGQSEKCVKIQEYIEEDMKI